MKTIVYPFTCGDPLLPLLLLPRFPSFSSDVGLTPQESGGVRHRGQVPWHYTDKVSYCSVSYCRVPTVVFLPQCSYRCESWAPHLNPSRRYVNHNGSRRMFIQCFPAGRGAAVHLRDPAAPPLLHLCQPRDPPLLPAPTTVGPLKPRTLSVRDPNFTSFLLESLTPPLLFTLGSKVFWLGRREGDEVGFLS